MFVQSQLETENRFLLELRLEGVRDEEKGLESVAFVELVLALMNSIGERMVLGLILGSID